MVARGVHVRSVLPYRPKVYITINVKSLIVDVGLTVCADVNGKFLNFRLPIISAFIYVFRGNYEFLHCFRRNILLTDNRSVSRTGSTSLYIANVLLLSQGLFNMNIFNKYMYLHILLIFENYDL